MRGPKSSSTEYGFSLSELVVVMAIMLSISAVVSMLYVKGRDAVLVGSERLEVSGAARRAVDALSPFIVSAVPGLGSDPLQVNDNTPDDLSDACSLKVSTSEPFLDPNYDYQRQFTYVTNQRPRRFLIKYDPATAELRAYQLTIASTGEEIDEDVGSRLLGSHISGCGFQLPFYNTVLVTLRTRSAREDERRPDGATTSLLTSYLTAPGVN